MISKSGTLDLGKYELRICLLTRQVLVQFDPAAAAQFTPELHCMDVTKIKKSRCQQSGASGCVGGGGA